MTLKYSQGETHHPKACGMMVTNSYWQFLHIKVPGSEFVRLRGIGLSEILTLL